jgi:hypothetical protein
MKVPEVPDKSTAKTKPAQASRRILYLQTGMDFYRQVRKPCCASRQSRPLYFRYGSDSEVGDVLGYARCFLKLGHRLVAAHLSVSDAAPRCARSRAVAQPMPRAPPATIAT